MIPNNGHKNVPVAYHDLLWSSCYQLCVNSAQFGNDLEPYG